MRGRGLARGFLDEERVSSCIFLRNDREKGREYTRTMRNNPPSPNLLLAHDLNQPQHSMKRAPRLERPDALQILAFEEEIDLRGRGLLTLVGRSDQRLGCLRGRCDAVERLAG